MKRKSLSPVALAAVAPFLVSVTAYGQGLGPQHQLDEEMVNKSLSTQSYSSTGLKRDCCDDGVANNEQLSAGPTIQSPPVGHAEIVKERPGNPLGF